MALVSSKVVSSGNRSTCHKRSASDKSIFLLDMENSGAGIYSFICSMYVRVGTKFRGVVEFKSFLVHIFGCKDDFIFVNNDGPSKKSTFDGLDVIHALRCFESQVCNAVCSPRPSRHIPTC